MTLIKLFISFLQVGLLSIGGGYAAIPLIQNEVVYKNAWINLQEFSNLVVIAEMTPGPIAINSATFVGIKIAGLKGALIATLGCITPSIIIISILAYIYSKYKNAKSFRTILEIIRPAIIAMILSAGLSILNQSLHVGITINYVSIFLFIFTFISLIKTKITPITLMLICGILSLIFTQIF